jgi:hypothetical protein
MEERKSGQKKAKKAIDAYSPKRPPGRPATVSFSAIEGRAHNYRGILDHVWDELWVHLSRADTEQDVISAFRSAIPNETQFCESAALILQVLKEKNFPKRRKPQIKFLADSIAGLGGVSLRRSRDICAEERARQKKTYQILRFEVYVVCSCGYQGQSLNLACKKCGAPTYIDKWLFESSSE